MRIISFFFLFLTMAGCIGTDLVDEPLSPAPGKAVIDQSELSLIPDESRALTFRLLAVDGSELPGEWFWSSRDEKVATVDEEGIVSAVAAGQTWIDGRVDPDLGDSVLVTVAADPDAVASVAIMADTTNLNVGETRLFEAVLMNADGQELSGIPVTWNSSDPAVATIDDSGLATALSDGITNVTATAEGVNSLPFRLMVGDPPNQRSGEFMGLNGYSVSGPAVLEKLPGGARLSFGDDFRAQNGPGLYVYLSPLEDDVKGGVNLGELKAVSGAQSYDIPDTVDPDRYEYVIVYCQPFGIPFGSCGLGPG